MKFLNVVIKRLSVILFLLMLVAPVAAQLNPQQQALLKVVFASELDYREIQQRWQALNDRVWRTQQEDFVMQDYAKKLAHDQDLMARYIANLKLSGVNFGTAAVLNARQLALNELLANEQNEIANTTALRAGIQAEITAIQNDPTIPPDVKAELIAQKTAELNELAGRLPIYENRKIILDALKAGGSAR